MEEAEDDHLVEVTVAPQLGPDGDDPFMTSTGFGSGTRERSFQGRQNKGGYSNMLAKTQATRWVGIHKPHYHANVISGQFSPWSR